MPLLDKDWQSTGIIDSPVRLADGTGDRKGLIQVQMINIDCIEILLACSMVRVDDPDDQVSTYRTRNRVGLFVGTAG